MRHRAAVPVIEDELEWRVLRQASAAFPAARVIATRWHSAAERTQEFGARTADDAYVVKIVLRSMNMQLSVAGRTIQDGTATPGMFHVTEPAASVRGVFRGPYDALHLHVPSALVAECACDVLGQNRAALRSGPAPDKDATVELLARALLQADGADRGFGQLYAEYVGCAIVTRLLAAGRERPKVAELARWRLKRAIDFVEARLDEPVSLKEIASAAGLTRMHFAAQFKAATGLRPHEYLLRRRIERSQELLAGSDVSLVDVALSVGFQTQSHFTVVFKRFVGQTPRAWREGRTAAMAD
jgi:AraC-like DNA-binding protein